MQKLIWNINYHDHHHNIGIRLTTMTHATASTIQAV